MATELIHVILRLHNSNKFSVIAFTSEEDFNLWMQSCINKFYINKLIDEKIYYIDVDLKPDTYI